MTHIDRLLKSSQNQRTRELLGAGIDDAPAPGSLQRAAAGLGVVVAGSTWSAAAAGAGSATGAAGSAIASAGTLTAVGTAKLLAIGALAGTLVSGASVAVHRAVESTSVAPVASAPSSALPPPSAPARVSVADLPRASALKPLPIEPAPASLAASAAPRASVRTEPNDSGALAAEVARIDAARSALSRGDTARALAEIAAYRSERRLGVLDREAALLAIRAHSERGDVERARELARSYLAQNPDDAHAPRLRELVR
jgi:hypothetical protein